MLGIRFASLSSHDPGPLEHGHVESSSTTAMTQIGILESEFPWGLLVISDAQSDLQVPDFASREVPTSASRDAAGAARHARL